MTLAIEHMVGLAGAAMALWLSCQQLDAAFRYLDIQALMFWTLHMQVAFAFLLRRKAVAQAQAQAQAQSVRNWLVCGASVFCMYLTDLSLPPSEFLDPAGKTLTTLGCVLAISAFAALGRGFGILPAFRQLATTGPYGIVRHPIYASYALMDIGILLSHPSTANWVIGGLDVGMLIVRLRTEEKVCLELSPHYLDYSSKVRFRLIPGIY